MKSYKQLSAYHHSPKIGESVVSMSGGPGQLSLETFFYYLVTINIVLRQIVFLYILTYPTSLFPVEQYRRWGFSGLMGLFFDSNNFAVIHEYLGQENIAKMKHDVAESQEVKSNLNWFESRRDLSDKELDADWERFIESTKSSSIGKDIHDWGNRIAFYKAQTRAIGWLRNYINFLGNPEAIPDEMLPKIVSIWKDW